MDNTISVIIPCYNQSQFLEETLLSVYNQTYSNWECIIVNDGSLDNTEEIAEKWCKKDNRVRYFLKENGGLSSARNYGLDKAKGEFIQLLDSDDLIKPEKFQEQLNDLLRKGDISISDYFPFMNGTNDQAPHRYLSPFLSEKKYKEEIILDWEYRKSIPCHSVIFKKELLENHELRFSEDLPNHEDWVFWVKLFYYSQSLLNNQKVLALYRIHSQSMTFDKRLMRKGFLLAARKLQSFFKEENNDELYFLAKKKYKEIYNKGRIPLGKRIKSQIYNILVPIYRYVKKN